MRVLSRRQARPRDGGAGWREPRDFRGTVSPSSCRRGSAANGR